MLKHMRMITAFASILALATLVIACGSEQAPTAQPSESTTNNTPATNVPVTPSSGTAGVSAPDAATTQPEVPPSGGSAAQAQPAAPTSQPMVVAPIPAAQPLPVSKPTVVAPTATPVPAPTAAAEPSPVPVETVDTAAGCPPPLPPVPGLYEHHETTAETDRAALIELFNAEPEGPIGQWPGIRTNQAGRVIELALDERLLEQAPEGTRFERLSDAIGDLSYLEVLDLSGLPLYDPLPRALGNLPRLRVLTWNNPHHTWGRSIDEDDGHEIPPELGSLANLEVLSLQGSGLDGEIPPQLCNLTNLRELDLSANPLTGEIPAYLGGLPRLEKLVLNFNRFTGSLPPELGNLSNLRTLSVYRNRLEGEIPAELGNLSNLEYLDLGRNPLTGEIPSEFGQLTNLVALHLGISKISGDVPEELGNLESLVYLGLGHPVYGDETPWEDGSPLENRLTGCVPANLPLNTFDDSIATVAMIDMGIVLETGLISGSTTPPYAAVPPCSLASGAISPADAAKEREALAALYHAAGGDGWDDDWWEGGHNWLTDAPVGDWGGVITDNQGHVVGLSLPIGRNAELAPEIAHLSYLRLLDIGRRSSAGGGRGISIPLPSPLGSLTRMESLAIWELIEDRHAIKDLLPQLGSMTRLQGLSFSDTEVTGEIPSELGNLTRLAYLDLAETNITGEIPAELGNLTRLEVLVLSGTGLTGQIPPELGNLARLGLLDLSNTEMSGDVPAELGNLTRLSWLRLSSTDITGCLPVSLRAQRVDLTQYHKPFCAEAEAPGSEVVALPTPAPTATPVPATPAPTDSAWIDGLPFEWGGSVEQDRQALTAIYHAMGGPNWNNNDNWLTDAPLDQWHGLYVWEGRVVGLVFFRNNLTGSIPPEVADLRMLVSLAINVEENLENPLPPELADLPNFGYLQLYETGLSGEIPAWLGNMKQLRWLDLRESDFTGEIPPELGNLSRLTELSLGTTFGDGLTGEIPPELGNLSNLEALSLNGNFSGDLRALEGFTNLVYLELPIYGPKEVLESMCVPRFLKGQLGPHKDTEMPSTVGSLDYC